MSQWNYEVMKIIKKPENKRSLKLYLSKIYEDLSTPSNNLMSKYSFICYIHLPIYISEKIFHIICSDNRNISKDEFINGMFKLYNGNFNEQKEIIFKLLDSDGDGFIHPLDTRIILKFIIREDKHESNIEYLIDCLFQGRTFMGENDFSNIITRYNSDIFLLLISFIIENAPFTENNLNIFNLDSKNVLKSLNYKEMNNPKLYNYYSVIRNPSKRVSNLMKIDIEDFINYEMEEELLSLE